MATFGDILAARSGLTGVTVRAHLQEIAAIGSSMLSAGDVQLLANAVLSAAQAAPIRSTGVEVEMLLKLARNKTITDSGSGVMTVYDDDGVTPLFTAKLYEDVSGTQAYRGQGADRRERLT